MRTITVILFLSSVMSARAELPELGETHFVSEHRLSIAAPPARVWQALTRDVSKWWNAAHSYSGQAGNFRLDAVAGGCFCESLADGSVEHLRVVFARENRELRMTGGLGPLQMMAVSGAMSFVLSPTDSGTALLYRYTVRGAGGEGLAKAVDAVQLDQLQRLKRFVETGPVKK